VLDPFIGDRNVTRAGELYLNLGTISEDILKDSRLLYENDLYIKRELLYKHIRYVIHKNVINEKNGKVNSAYSIMS
jgi:cell surface protein SprA